MSMRNILAIVLYILAVGAPVGALAARFGLETRIDLSGAHETFDQLLSIACAVVAGFVMATFAGRLLSQGSDNLMDSALDMFREGRRKGER